MCDTIVVRSARGTLFAKNSDRDPNEAQVLEWQPRRGHAPEAKVRCTWIEIPQATQTNAVLLSRPFWTWGAEMGANEHGVVIGNEAVFTNQRTEPTGLTGMDLVRLALERGARAATARDVLLELLSRHGQGGGCGLENPRFTYHNSFLVADPEEAYVVETAGRQWATERVDRFRSISNGLSIPGFRERYSDIVKTTVSACRARSRRSAALAEGALAHGARGVAEMMALLRDHGAGQPSPRHSVWNGGMGALCMHAGGMVASAQTTGSWVADLSETSIQHWVTATAAPCLALLKPVRVDAPVDLGPAPTEVADEASLWWRHERLHRLVLTDYARLVPLFVPERDRIEREWLADAPESAPAFARGDRLLADWTERVQRAARGTPDRRPAWLVRYWAKRDRWAGLRTLPTIEHAEDRAIGLQAEISGRLRRDREGETAEEERLRGGR